MNHLYALESLHRELDGVQRLTGLAYDYLDRGHPDPQQHAETWESIQRYEASAAELRARLEAHVQRLRAEEPQIVRGWVEMHLRILEAIIIKTLAEEASLSDAQTRLYIARSTAMAWLEVLEGKRTNVEINARFLDDYDERLLEQLPDLKVNKASPAG